MYCCVVYPYIRTPHRPLLRSSSDEAGSDRRGRPAYVQAQYYVAVRFALVGDRTGGSRWGGGLPVSRKKRPHVAFRLRLASAPFLSHSSRLVSSRSRLPPPPSPRLAPAAAAAASALPPPENSPIHPQTLNKSSIAARGNPAHRRMEPRPAAP